MKTHTSPKPRRRAVAVQPRPVLSDPQALKRAYVEHTRRLGPDFDIIDVWLMDHRPELWQQIHRQDDELFRLRRLATGEREYTASLENFIGLCREAERLYYEARPDELSLPLLAEGETVAVYFTLADGSVHKVSGIG